MDQEVNDKYQDYKCHFEERYAKVIDETMKEVDIEGILDEKGLFEDNAADILDRFVINPDGYIDVVLEDFFSKMRNKPAFKKVMTYAKSNIPVMRDYYDMLDKMDMGEYEDLMLKEIEPGIRMGLARSIQFTFQALAAEEEEEEE